MEKIKENTKENNLCSKIQIKKTRKRKKRKNIKLIKT